MADEKDLPLGDDEPLPLESDQSEQAPGGTKITAFGANALQKKQAHGRFNRTPTMTGQGAIRCRIFNSKVTVSAMEFMAEQINDWLDHNDIEVKHVNEVLGTLEGKTHEPNVIITVWY